MKTIVAGNDFIVKSDLTVEQLRTVETYEPDALKLFDDKGNVTFQVAVSDSETSGMVTKYGITFCDLPTLDGYAHATMTVNGDIGEFINDVVLTKFVAPLANLKTIEEKILGDDILGKIAERNKAIVDNIVIA